MKTISDVVAALEAAKGREVMAKLSAPVDPHERDLPIRDYRTGAIVAWVPEKFADGLLPVVYNGLVVGYYKDTPQGTLSPFFFFFSMISFSLDPLGERWVQEFDNAGPRFTADLLSHTLFRK